MALGKMDGSVVPTASNADAPRPRMAGVEMVAPPTPKAPDSTPVATPAPTVRTSRSGPASTTPLTELAAHTRGIHGYMPPVRRDCASAGPCHGQLLDVAEGEGGHAGIRRGPQRH